MNIYYKAILSHDPYKLDSSSAFQLAQKPAEFDFYSANARHISIPDVSTGAAILQYHRVWRQWIGSLRWLVK